MTTNPDVPYLDAQGRLATPSVLSQIDARADARMKVRVPDSGTAGQVLQRTATGTAWADAPKGGSALVLSGPGRPDQPSTTAGVITGAEPVGARYESTDEAGVGARTWRKVAGGKWVVTDGDTGWREITAAAVDPAASQPGGRIFVRRLGPALAGIRVLGLAPLTADGIPMVETDWLPLGFRNQGTVMFYLTDLGRGESKGGVAARLGSSAWWKYARPLKINTTTAADAKGEVIFVTADPWPSAPLPGTAA